VEELTYDGNYIDEGFDDPRRGPNIKGIMLHSEDDIAKRMGGLRLDEIESILRNTRPELFI